MIKWVIVVKEKMKRAFSSFFVTIIASLFTTICSLILGRLTDGTTAYDVVQRLMATGALYTVLSFFMDRCALRRIKQKSVKQLIALFIALVFVFPANFRDFYWIQYASLMWLAFLLAFLLPYRTIGDGFAHLMVRLMRNIMETFLFSAALMIGLSGLIASVEVLFELSIYNDIYFDLFKIIFGVFSVAYFLGLVPEKSKRFTVSEQGANFFKLNVYILMPILCAYAVLLHAYFLKILLERHLPDGMVGNLVLWFACVTFFVLFFSKDYFEKSAWSKRFHKFFPFLLVIPMVLFFIAMSVRVSAYGMTFNRYFAYALAIYLIGAGILIRFSKKDLMRSVVGLSVPILILSVYGPFSAEAMTLRSQMQRLEMVLRENEMLDSQGKVIAEKMISTSEKEKIERAVIYLIRHYDPSQITFLPENFEIKHSKEVFGFDFYPYVDVETRSYFTVESLYNRQEAMDLKGADYLMRLERYSDLHLEIEKGLSLKYDSKETAIKVLEMGKETASLSVEEVALLVVASPEDWPKKSITLEDGRRLEAEFNFLDLSGERFGGDLKEVRIGYFKTYVLFKVLPKIN